MRLLRVMTSFSSSSNLLLRSSCSFMRCLASNERGAGDGNDWPCEVCFICLVRLEVVEVVVVDLVVGCLTW